jgi:hypothetical protein
LFGLFAAVGDAEGESDFRRADLVYQFERFTCAVFIVLESPALYDCSAVGEDHVIGAGVDDFVFFGGG